MVVVEEREERGREELQNGEERERMAKCGSIRDGAGGRGGGRWKRKHVGKER